MPQRKVVILQSNYIPWKGYFDLIKAADLFIFYDDVQYTHDDWRNRNKIVTKDGLKWLTIPVGRDNTRKINEVKFIQQSWKVEHKQLLIDSYKDSVGYDQKLLDLIYDNDIDYLSEFNQHAIKVICDKLGITTNFDQVENYELVAGKTERLIDLLKKVGATEYISGPSAKSYLDEQLFEEAGVNLIYFDYSGYPEYPQKYVQFSHEVSVLDLIFNVGRDSRSFLKKD